MVPLRRLKPDKKNARTHSKRQIAELAKSIRQFGWTMPLLVDEDRTIIAGHARQKAAEQLGLHQVPVIALSGLSDAEKRALALADNKIASKAGWDRAILAAELGELSVLLPEMGLDISLTGFEAFELDTLITDAAELGSAEADAIPETETAAVSQTGDLWKLGEHRLVCGNAQSAGDFALLMAGQMAAMVITDPPYNVRIASVQGRGRIKHRNFGQAAGEMSEEQFTLFLRTTIALLIEHSRSGSIHYVFMDWKHIGELLAAAKALYDEWKNLVVWNKTNAGQGSFYRSQHELLCVFKNGTAAHVNNFELGQNGRTRSNVWTYAGVNSFRAGRLDELKLHPTVKPVALVADAMRDCSRRGEIVLDPFMGSGTAIVAAESVGRIAYGIELDPLYVDVAIRRWQKFTGWDAILAPTGETFDELTARSRPIAAELSSPKVGRVRVRIAGGPSHAR
jgi:DNA modification methylase